MLSSSSERKVSRAGRAECYKARDAFYLCVKESGVLYTSGTPVPNKCKQLRSKFESACLASWVKHFDELQGQRAREVKDLHKAIDSKATASAGNLAGTSQQ